MKNVGLEVIGRARKVIVTKDETTIIEGAGAAVDVKARIKEIAAQAVASKSSYDRESLQKRQAALGGKVAVIKVGGATETEIEEKKFRVDDAVAAVKAAMDEGIVAGGGVTLINLAATIATSNADDAAVAAGKTILKLALEQPFRILLVLHQVNAETNTFVIVGKAAGNLPIKHYTVKVSSAEILTQVVKTYWNEIVKVNVKPTNQEAESDELEFIRAVPSDNMLLKAKQL